MIERRSCAMEGCSREFIPKHSRHRFCSEHTRAKPNLAHNEKYGWPHRRRRAAWKPAVAGGSVVCPRCREPILAGEKWDLGHDDETGAYSGPEHARCNRATMSHRNGNGSYSRLRYLEEKVPFGIVRCGLCGWRIRKGMGWRVGHNGPEHEACEHAGEPPGADSVRLWSQDWGLLP